MKLWGRRLLYLTGLLIWLGFMAFPVVAFFLATNGQVVVGDNGRSHIRLFLVQEDGGSGVGIEWARRSHQDNACQKTSVNYLLWEGKGESAVYCQCRAENSDQLVPAQTNRCSSFP
ncbi:MAG: hypothetical protein Kow0080_18890 [Candidatus Promineifilaceae bacterium]